jgi:hypothetical protein
MRITSAWLSSCSGALSPRATAAATPCLLRLPRARSYGCAATNNNNENPGAPVQCSTFRSRFSGGAALCNTIFGSTFAYSTNASSCLSPYFYSAINPNAAVTGWGASNTPTPTATPAAAPTAAAALTQSQALAIGLGVGIGVPVLLVAVAIAAFFCGTARAAKTDAARTQRSARALEMAGTAGKSVVPWPDSRAASDPTA